MKGYTEDELEDWLSKIENVNKKVCKMLATINIYIFR